MDADDWAAYGVVGLMASVPVILLIWFVQAATMRRWAMRRAKEPWSVPEELSGSLPRPIQFRYSTSLGSAVIIVGATGYSCWALFTGHASLPSWPGIWMLAAPFVCYGMVRWTSFSTQDERRLLEQGLATEGTLIGRRHFRYSASLEFEYKPSSGKQRHGKRYSAYGHWTYSLREGDSVTVLYDSEDDGKFVLYPCDRWKIRT